MEISKHSPLSFAADPDVKTMSIEHGQSILSVSMRCTQCDWVGFLGQCDAHDDGNDGELACPKCNAIAVENKGISE